MAYTPWKSPSANSIYVTRQESWNLPENAYVADGAYALTTHIIGTKGGNGHVMLYNGFGFVAGDIPAYSVIQGIEVRRLSASSNMVVTGASLGIKVHSTAEASATYSTDPIEDDISDGVPTIYRTHTQLNGSEMWETTIGRSDILDSEFGVALNFTITANPASSSLYLDHLQVRIKYLDVGFSSPAPWFLSTPVIYADVDLTGGLATTLLGAMNVPHNTLELTGNLLTSSNGTVAITEGVGASTVLTGLQASINDGELSVVTASNIAILLDGLQADITSGTLAVATGSAILLSGLQASLQRGDLSVAAGTTVELNGLEANLGLGTLSLSHGSTIALLGELLSLEEGVVSLSFTDGVAISLTGELLTATPGEVGTAIGADTIIALLGQQLSLSRGVTTQYTEYSSVIELAGKQLVATAGSLSVVIDTGALELTGEELSLSSGEVSPSIGVLASLLGEELTAALGTTSNITSSNLNLLGRELTLEFTGLTALVDLSVCCKFEVAAEDRVFSVAADNRNFTVEAANNIFEVVCEC